MIPFLTAIGGIEVQQGEWNIAAATILNSLLAYAGSSGKAGCKRLRSSEEEHCNDSRT
jgi:hypothetical protein